MRINQNIAAYNSYRNVSTTNSQMSKSLEKLSSGLRINRAADDAAGLVVSQGLRAQVSGLKVATRNAQDGISVVQTAEGALSEVHNLLGRMRDLAVQASNKGSAGEGARDAAANEASEDLAEIGRIFEQTKFGSTNLFDGNFEGAFQVGANAGEQIGVEFAKLVTGTAAGATGLNLSNNGTVTNASQTFDVAAAGFDFSGGNTLSFDISIDGAASQTVTVSTDVTDITGLVGALNTAAGAAVFSEGTGADAGKLVVGSTLAGAAGSIVINNVDDGGSGNTSGITDTNVTGSDASNFVDKVRSGDSSAITTLDEAIKTVSDLRATLGAKQNRFESAISNLQVATENLSASESRIRDTDMALEMTNFTRNQILQQAGTAMLGQANQLPQGVLRLLG
ncbi:MAG: flagellin [Acidimicrobiia bacterium]|nr:flagellin [Acidimicrobiia bacterium]